MSWMPGIPHQQGGGSGGQRLNPIACVEHRTIGRWAGDYSVLSRGRVPSVHFLVGQDRGQWVQFWDTNWTAAHAAGANEWAVGIEFSGQNGENLTAWQIEAGGQIHHWLMAAHGIAKQFLDNGGGRVSSYHGFLNHSNVATSRSYMHYDYIRRDEWDRMVGGVASAPEAPRRKSEGMVCIDQNTGIGWQWNTGWAKPIESGKVYDELHYTGHEALGVVHPLTMIDWMRKYGAWDEVRREPRRVEVVIQGINETLLSLQQQLNQLTNP